MQRTNSVLATLTRLSFGLLALAPVAGAQEFTDTGSPEPLAAYDGRGPQPERPFAPWYVGASFGLADAGYSSGDLEAELANAGFGGVTSDTDDTEFGFQVYGGYRLHPRLSVELGFFDLGEIDSALNIPAGTDETELLDTVERVHDVAGYGAFLALKGSAYQQDGWDVWGKIGGFLWWSDAEIDGPTQRRGFDDNGFDLLLGAGVTYRIDDHWALQGEIDGFRLDGEWIPFYSVGVQYLFLARDEVRSAPLN